MRKLYFLIISLFVVNFIVAQTGPAGVGNSSSNVIWLDGNVLNYSTVPYLNSWPDQSGNGNDFVQGTASRQPKRVTYYGHNAVGFDGGDWVRAGAIGALNTTNHTQYIVYNGNKADHTGVLYESGFSQSNQFLRTYRNSAGNIQSWVLNNTGGTVKNTTTNNSAFQIISSHWDGGAQTWTSYQDGTSFSSQGGANGNPTGNYRNSIGSTINNGFPFKGDIGEVIIYNTVLNSAQRKIIDNYLSSKFKITISNDMYSYDGGLSYQYELIGLGQEADGNNLVGQGKGIVELSIGSLSNGDYIFVGHDNIDLSSTTNDVPATIVGGARLGRVWRTGITGTPGNVDLVYDVSSLSLPAGSYYLLVESDNGIFNDGGVAVYGPFNDVGGLVTFSSVTLAEGDYFTLATGTSPGISSVQTGDWNSASTWNCNCVPVSTDDVTVSTGHTVSATTTTVVNDLTVNGELNTLSTGSFSIKGNYSIGVGGTASHKTVTFNGTSTQNMTNSSTGTVNFKTLVIDNNNGVSVQSGKFSVSNSLTVSNGPLTNVSGTFTLLSNLSKTAVIVNGSGGFAGNFVLQRFLSQRNASWGDLSSPVSGNHLRDWDSDPSGTVAELLMCGVNGFSGNCGGWNSVYDYDESAQSYVAVTDTTYVLTAGTGVEIWLDDDGGTLYDKTFDSRGTPNFGDVVVPVETSWNLLGNPYHAWINYSSLTKPTITGAYYIWNTNNGSYDVAFTGSIPPNQAFWVESTGSGNVTFSESAKTGSGSSTFYRLMDDDFVEAIIKVKNNNDYYVHELKLQMRDMASEELDEFDASFKPSLIEEAPSITSHPANSSKKLAINSFSYKDEVIIPINIEVGLSGKYTVESVDFELFKGYFRYIELKNNKTGKVYNLNFKTDEKFTIDIEKEIGEGFTLRLSNLISSANESINENVNIYKTLDHTIIEFDNTAMSYEIMVFNVMGQKVMEPILSKGENSVEINNSKFPHGINLIKVRTPNNKIVKKLNY